MHSKEENHLTNRSRTVHQELHDAVREQAEGQENCSGQTPSLACAQALTEELFFQNRQQIGARL